MKKLIALLLALTATSASASIKGAPFMPESDARFDTLEKMQPSSFTGDITATAAGVTSIGALKVTDAMLIAPTSSTQGNFPAHILKATWDPSGVSGQRTVGAHTFAATIPAKSIIIQSWYYVVTPVASTNSDGTVAFSCVAANDIFSAGSPAASGTVNAGVSTGTAANMKYVTTACPIVGTVAVDAFTAGKIDIFVEYVPVGE